MVVGKTVSGWKITTRFKVMSMDSQNKHRFNEAFTFCCSLEESDVLCPCLYQQLIYVCLVVEVPWAGISPGDKTSASLCHSAQLHLQLWRFVVSTMRFSGTLRHHLLLTPPFCTQTSSLLRMLDSSQKSLSLFPGICPTEPRWVGSEAGRHC